MLSYNFFRPTWLSSGARRLKNVSVILDWTTSTGHQLCAAITLAEGETIRWMIHQGHPDVISLDLALRTLDGRTIDATEGFTERSLADSALCGFMFFNGEMYYHEGQLRELMAMLACDTIDQRKEFFVRCLLLRRRERHMWIDTDLAKLFVEEVDWGTIHERALVEVVQKKLRMRAHDLEEVFGTTYHSLHPLCHSP